MARYAGLEATNFACERAPANQNIKAQEAAMDLYGKVFVENKFSGGVIRVPVGELSESLYWELGGGNCIAYVDVPNPDQWQESHRFHQFEREMFLSCLAAEICRLECPDAIYEIGSDQIIFLTRTTL